MKSSLVFLLSASALVVGCAGSSPLAPDAASVSGTRSLAASSAASNAPRTFLPPISPAGISCPSDSPLILVGSFGRRMDIDFSEVTGADAYEIEIVNYYGEVVLLVVPAPANRVEWYGKPGFYSVRVRTQNCGGTGKWSVYAYQTLEDGNMPAPQPPGEVPAPTTPPSEPVPPGPQCGNNCSPPPPPPPLECVTGCF